jgi:hypothetical protein
MITDPKTGQLHLVLESKKLPPPPGAGPGLKVDLKTEPALLNLAPLASTGSETKGTLDFPDPMALAAEILGALPIPGGSKRK